MKDAFYVVLSRTGYESAEDNSGSASNENTTLSPNVQKSDFDGLHSVRYSDKRDRLF